jgi:hypothetical protein
VSEVPPQVTAVMFGASRTEIPTTSTRFERFATVCEKVRLVAGAV